MSENEKAQKARMEAFIDVYEKTACNVSEACEKANIARGTYYNWRKEKWFSDAIDSAKVIFIDDVESALYKNAIEGHVSAQIFIMKCLGKDRGYVERQEITGADGGPIQTEGEKPDYSKLDTKELMALEKLMLKAKGE